MRLSISGVVIASLGSLSLLAACPGPKMPSGPPPEYEEPPPPSWLKDAAAEAEAPSGPLEAPPPSAPGDDGGLPSS